MGAFGLGPGPGRFASPIFGERAAPPAAPRTFRFENARWARYLHGALLATALVIFAQPIAPTAGLVAGATGALAGALLAERLAAARLRLAAVAALAALVLAVSLGLAAALVGASVPARLASPAATLALAEMLRWGGFASALALLLRALALRFRAALVLEAGLGVLAVATTVAAHRDGMIARPLGISDWFWSQGIDPVVAFLGLGLVAGLLLAAVMAHGRSKVRTGAQLLLVLLLGLLIALRLHGVDLDRQRQSAGGGQAEKREENGGGQGQGKERGEQQGQGRNDDLPQAGQQQNKRPTAVVIFHKDVAPASGVFYFRHAAFSQFNGLRLVEATLPRLDMDVVRAFPAAPTPVETPAAEAQGRTLVATDVALLTDHRRLFALTDAVEVSPLANPSPARFRRAYHVVSAVFTEPYAELLHAAPGDPSWSDETLAHYLEHPKDPRYRALATTLREGLKGEYQDSPLALGLAVKRYLEENATYSFERDYDGADDPTAAFLFSQDMRGYCVHLAHAAAYLLRALGVPTRVSAGYGVPAQNLAGGSSLLIKSSDAHAWAELFLEGYGWVPLEVTPEKTDVKPEQFAEKDLQQLLGEMARKEGRREEPSQLAAGVLELLRALWRALPWVLLALVAGLYLFKYGRLLAPRLVPRRRRPLAAYRAALDRLSAVGIVRARGEPRERFARRASSSAPSFDALTSRQVGLAFGSAWAQADAAREPRRSLLLAGSVGRELRTHVPWWRWLAGALNPVSWIWSR